MNSRLFATTGFLSALLLVAADARADLERRDSSQFAYKYEMVERPDQQDLDGGGANDFTGWSAAFSQGAGADVGTIKIDASSNGKYLLSNQAPGTAGDGWRSLGASSSTGFTVEARVRVTECTGNNGAICIEAGPSDSKVYARLNLFDDCIGWNGTALTNLDTSAWHTYRIAREGGKAVHSVFVDGILVAENLGTGFTYNNSTLYRMLLGSPGSGWTGKAEVMWLRFDKGAYAPPSAADRPKRKASVDFPVKFDLDEGDDRISAEGTTDCWKLGGSGATIARNRTSLSVTTGGKSSYWDTTDAAWKDLVGADTPYTIEFRVKINGTTQSGADRALNVTSGSPAAVGNLFLGTNGVQWCLSTKGAGTFVELDDSDNTDGWHIFRIAHEGSTRHGFTVWRDGVVLGEQLVDCVNFYKFSGNALGLVRFGKAGGLNDGSWTLDYIRWETGAVWDWKNPPAPFVLVVR